MAEKQEKFEWTKARSELAILLADGYTIKEAAQKAKVAERTAYRWNSHPDFAMEVDRLSCMIGIASRAERLRIVRRVVRQRFSEELVTTKRDLLDWLKFAAEETDEVKLNLADLIGEFITTKRKDVPPISGEGSGGDNQQDPDQ